MITRIALAVFGVVFVSSLTMPSAPGGLVFIYLILCAATLVAAIAGKKKTKIIAIALLLFSIILTVHEYRAGQGGGFRERANKVKMNSP